MISLLQISNLIDGNVTGNQNLEIKGVCDIETGKKDCITYIKNHQFQKYITNNQASAFVVDSKIDINQYDKSFIVVKNPSLAFIQILNFFKEKNMLVKNNISKNAIISTSAKIGKDVSREYSRN